MRSFVTCDNKLYHHVDRCMKKMQKTPLLFQFLYTVYKDEYTECYLFSTIEADGGIENEACRKRKLGLLCTVYIYTAAKPKKNTSTDDYVCT